MLIPAGQVDQRPAQALPNYGLMYTGEKLDRDLTLAGAVRVTLHVSSDCPDTDFIAKLIEVTPDGCTLLLMDGVTRALYRESILDPDQQSPAATRTRHGLSRHDQPGGHSPYGPRRQPVAGRHRQQ